MTRTKQLCVAVVALAIATGASATSLFAQTNRGPAAFGADFSAAIGLSAAEGGPLLDDGQSVDWAAGDADQLLEGLVCVAGNPGCQTDLPVPATEITVNVGAKAIIGSNLGFRRRSRLRVFSIHVSGPREGAIRGFDRPPRTA